MDSAHLSDASTDPIDDALLALRARADAGPRPIVVLIDPALNDPFALVDFSSPTLHRVPVPVVFRDLDKAHSPYLLWFERETRAEAVFNQTVHLAAEEARSAVGGGSAQRSVCAWLLPATGTSPAELAGALAKAAVVRDISGRPRYLRFFDPRVTEHLPRILGEPLFWPWLGMIDEWHYIDRLVRLTSLYRPNVSTTSSAVSAAQWQQLERIGTVNKLLLQAPAWGVAQLPDLSARLDGYLRHAAQCGLATERDQIVFVTCCLCVGVGFERHPEVLAILERAKRGEARFADAMAAMEDAQLEAIAIFTRHDHTGRSAETRL